MSYVLALGMAWSVADVGAAVEAERVRALVRELDDPRFLVREQADEALRRAGLGVVPVLRAELQQHPPLEVARRLQGIIDHYTRPDWRERVEEAVAEAQRTGKPLLVVVTPPTGDDPDRWTAPAIEDARLAHFLKEHFVVVWHVDASGVLFFGQTRPNGAGRNGVRGLCQCYLCAADGTVKQYQHSLPTLDQLADPSGAPRPLPEPVVAQPIDASPVVGVQVEQVRNLQDFRLNPKLQGQMASWGRQGPVNPVGQPIEQVLNAQHRLQFLLGN